ncbi:hypothetical protein [Actinophytocola sp. KF-1]
MAVVVAVLCVLLVPGHPAAAQPGADIGSVLSRVERERVVRLPGAVTSVDAGRLAARDRVLLAPAAGLPDDLGPLWAWADDEGVRLTVVEGWWISRQGEQVRVEREALPWVLASGDVTDVVVGATAPVPQRVTATAELLDGLRVDRFEPGVRLVTLPARPDPVTGYAAALAERFPGELVVVACGAWLEVAGQGADQAASARDATYGLMLLRRGSPLGPDADDLVTAVLERNAGPAPRRLYTPVNWDTIRDTVCFWLALLIVAVGVWLLVRHRRAAAVAPMRMAWAKAHLRVQLLEARSAGAPAADTARARPGRDPVGKRCREKRDREPGRAPTAPEPTARARGTTSLRAGVYLAGLIAYSVWRLALSQDPADEEQYTPRNAADQLRYSSVYAVPLGHVRASLDVEEARGIIGNRPLVAVAGFPTMCAEIAEELPGVIVVVVNPDPGTPIVDCAREGSFHDPALLRDVRDATTYLATGEDRTAYLAEYVRAFDARHPSLRRDPTDDGDLTDDLIVVLPLLVALGLAAAGAVALHRTWHTTNTRLNRLATLLAADDTGPPPRDGVETATEYLRALHGFDTATTKEQRATTAQRITALERTVGARPAASPRAPRSSP